MIYKNAQKVSSEDFINFMIIEHIFDILLRHTRLEI